MLYLSGKIFVDDRPLPDGIGWMLTDQRGRPRDDGRRWAADNGCFARGASFDIDTYLDWLASLPSKERCLFATAPDVVGNAVETLANVGVCADIRSIGLPAAFVGQDGLEDYAVPWHLFDCYFVGGSTTWKLSEASYDLIAEAKRRGKWIHVGRVNSWRRFKASAIANVDSVDGTFLAFGPDKNMDRLTSWLSDAGHVGYLDLFPENVDASY